eukprot:439121-Pyramimonas_sp.AAC.1
MQAPCLKTRPSSSLDGFVPCTLHFRGYSLLVIIFNGICSIGLAGPNLVRLRRLGSPLAALQLPWVVLGDWNVPPQTLQASGFLSEVGGMIRRADVEYTCDPGGGKKAAHLDYL